ncbi:hypothetical protein KCU87_g490, partial [Aureobasidium melanogenum]
MCKQTPVLCINAAGEKKVGRSQKLMQGSTMHPTTPDVAAAHASVLDSRSLDTVAIRRPMYPLHPSKENDHAPVLKLNQKAQK